MTNMIRFRTVVFVAVAMAALSGCLEPSAEKTAPADAQMLADSLVYVKAKNGLCFGVGTTSRVDTGATNLSMPSGMIAALGLMPLRSRRVMTTGGIRDAAIFGAVQLNVEGRDCLCDVTEIADGCPVLIGQVPLELMDFVVDSGRRRLIGNPAHGGEQMLELM